MHTKNTPSRIQRDGDFVFAFACDTVTDKTTITPPDLKAIKNVLAKNSLSTPVYLKAFCFLRSEIQLKNSTIFESLTTF